MRTLAALLALSLLAACTPPETEDVALSELGEQTTATGGLLHVRFEGFSVTAVVLEIRDEEVLLFEYPDEAATEADLALLSDDGLFMGETRMPWEPPVHIFATGTQIAVYRGNTEAVLSALVSEGGPQVAGARTPLEVELEEPGRHP